MMLMSELYRSLSGALRLACFKQDGILFFENTVKAFWRSFWAAAIAFPPYVFLLFIRVEPSIINVGPSTAILIHCIAYVAGWFAFPLVMFYLCNLINRQTHFCRYCAAHNWAALLQIVVMLVITSVDRSGMITPGLAGTITMILIILIFFYQGFIARVGLQISIFGSIGIVVTNLLVGLIIELWATKLLSGQKVLFG